MTQPRQLPHKPYLPRWWGMPRACRGLWGGQGAGGPAVLSVCRAPGASSQVNLVSVCARVSVQGVCTGVQGLLLCTAWMGSAGAGLLGAAGQPALTACGHCSALAPAAPEDGNWDLTARHPSGGVGDAEPGSGTCLLPLQSAVTKRCKTSREEQSNPTAAPPELHGDGAAPVPGPSGTDPALSSGCVEGTPGEPWEAAWRGRGRAAGEVSSRLCFLPSL